MRKTLWDGTSRRELLDRLSHLTPDATRRWGKMNVTQMLAHMTDALKLARGELHGEPRKVIIRYPVLKQLLIFVLPFPKGVPTAPELMGNDITDWDSGIADLRNEIEYFATCDRTMKWPEHPAWGNMTPRAWGVLSYRHVDHHFKQFGI